MYSAASNTDTSCFFVTETHNGVYFNKRKNLPQGLLGMIYWREGAVNYKLDKKTK